MRRAIALALVLVLASIALPVAAQEETPTPTEAGNETSVVEQVDDRLRVTEFSYNAEEEVMSVTFENIHPRRSSTVTMTEVIDRGTAKSGTFGITRFDVRPGETVTHEVSAKRVDGSAAVMITTELSVEQNTGTFLSENRETDVYKGDPSWAHVNFAAVVGIILAVAIALIAIWRYYAKKDHSVAEAGLGAVR